MCRLTKVIGPVRGTMGRTGSAGWIGLAQLVYEAQKEKEGGLKEWRGWWVDNAFRARNAE